MSGHSNGVTAESVAILSWLRQREDEMAAFLAELVAVPTENPPGKNYHACAGLDCERLAPGVPKEDAQDVPECLLASHGNGERVLYFHGHYDVFPAQTPEQFQPLRKGHFLFRRGSCDMKGGIVAMLYAIRVLKESRAELKGRIALALVPNEETDGTGATAWLAQQGLLGRDGIGMLLAEPTSGVVWNANRGAITLRVRVLGKPAHVGLQRQGKNAFERMHGVVEKLQQLKREVEKRTTRSNIGSEQARNSILMLGGESGGGTNFNVVPAECWFTVDRRINPEEDLDTEKTKLLDVLERCKQDGIPLEWEILREGRSAFSNEQGPLAEALSRSVEVVTGEAPHFEMCPGCQRFAFMPRRGYPRTSKVRDCFPSRTGRTNTRPEKNGRYSRHLCTDSDGSAEALANPIRPRGYLRVRCSRCTADAAFGEMSGLHFPAGPFPTSGFSVNRPEQ